MQSTTCHDPLIPLETGSPAFPVPEILEKAIHAPGACDEWTEYPPLEGLPRLRELLATEHSLWTGSKIVPEQVLVTHGAMNALFTICSTMLQPGDEVLIPAPFWHHFPNILKYLPVNLRPIITERDQDYKLTPDLLATHLGPSSRLLILTTPNNPTGTIYSHQELDALSEVAMAHPNLMVLSDEAYNFLPLGCWGDTTKPCPGLRVDAACQDRLFRVGSISKNFGLAGLRVGYVIAGARHIERLAQRQRFSALGVNPRLQQGAIAVLENKTAVLRDLLAELNVRKDFARDCMARFLPEMTYLDPMAGYYFFADTSPWLGAVTPCGAKICDDRRLAEWLRAEAAICVQPSTDCGLPGFFRLTFAVAPQMFEMGVRRMKTQLERLILR